MVLKNIEWIWIQELIMMAEVISSWGDHYIAHPYWLNSPWLHVSSNLKMSFKNNKRIRVWFVSPLGIKWKDFLVTQGKHLDCMAPMELNYLKYPLQFNELFSLIRCPVNAVLRWVDLQPWASWRSQGTSMYQLHISSSKCMEKRIV